MDHKSASPQLCRALPHMAPYVPPTPRTVSSPAAPVPVRHGLPRSPKVMDILPPSSTARAVRPPAPTRSRFVHPAATYVPTRPAAKEILPTPVSHTSTTSEATRPRQPKSLHRRWRQVGEIAQYPLLALVAIIAAQSTTIGQWFVLAYALYALVRRQRSQLSFGIALFLLLSIPVFQLLHQGGIAQAVAIYTYELLVVGTLQAIIELYKSRSKQRADV